jgi:hypothetical protein
VGLPLGNDICWCHSWCARKSWRVPAGGSPVQVSRSGRLVMSVARAVGDDGREAYTMTVWGVQFSRETYIFAEAEIVTKVEGNMNGPDTQGAAALPWSESTSRMEGTRRNLGGLVFDRKALRYPARVGEARNRSR